MIKILAAVAAALSCACQSAPSFTGDAPPIRVMGRSPALVEDVEREAGLAWGSVPDVYCGNETPHVDIELKKDHYSHTRVTASIWSPSSARVTVSDFGWPIALWHEVFHARTLLALDSVPPIIQEGLAEYFGAPSGLRREALRARLFAIASGRAVPDAYLQFSSEASGRKLTILLTAPAPAHPSPSGRDFFRASINLSLDEVGELSNSERVLHYASSFVFVYAIIGQGADAELPDFSKHWGESASTYMSRLGIGNAPSVRALAEKESARYSDLDSYWHVLVPYIYRGAVLYPDASAFLLGTEAVLALGDGEPLRLESHGTYQGLVQEYYTIHAKAADAASTVLSQDPPM